MYNVVDSEGGHSGIQSNTMPNIMKVSLNESKSDVEDVCKVLKGRGT